MTNSTNPNQALFDQFIKEKQFLDGVSPETVRSYTEGWKAFKRYGSAELSDSAIKDFMIAMLQSGVPSGGRRAFEKKVCTSR